MLTVGGLPTVSYVYRSTSHDGQVSGCRGGVVRLPDYVSVDVRLDRGTAYSSGRRQTSWSLFDTALVTLPGSLIHVLHERLFTAANRPVISVSFVNTTE